MKDNGDGTVTLKKKSYLAAQQRQAVAEMALVWAQRDIETAHKWARDCLEQERRANARCEFLYGMARACGLSVEDLT